MYTDKTLTCRDCGQSFTFTVGEQEFFASRGLLNEPGRCPECRAARKSRGGGGGYSTGGGYSSGGYGGGSGGGSYDRQERQMFTATCSSCGKEARVPFQPRPERPVYCSDCFTTQRGDTGGGYSRNRS